MFKYIAIMIPAMFVSSIAFAQDAGAPLSITQAVSNLTYAGSTDPIKFRKECSELNKISNFKTTFVVDANNKHICEINEKYSNETLKIAIVYNSYSTNMKVIKNNFSDKKCTTEFQDSKVSLKQILLKKVNETQLKFLTAADNEITFALKQNMLRLDKVYDKSTHVCEISTFITFDEEPE